MVIRVIAGSRKPYRNTVTPILQCVGLYKCKLLVPFTLHLPDRKYYRGLYDIRTGKTHWRDGSAYSTPQKWAETMWRRKTGNKNATISGRSKIRVLGKTLDEWEDKFGKEKIAREYATFWKDGVLDHSFVSNYTVDEEDMPVMKAGLEWARKNAAQFGAVFAPAPVARVISLSNRTAFRVITHCQGEMMVSVFENAYLRSFLGGEMTDESKDDVRMMAQFISREAITNAVWFYADYL